MLSKQVKIMEILSEILEKERKFINKHKNAKTSIELYTNIYEDISMDFNNIKNINSTTLKLIIDEFDINDVLKDKLKSNLEVLICILNMNDNNDTTIQITVEQKESVDIFLENLLSTLNSLKVSIPLEEKQYQESKIYIKDIQSLIKKLNKKDNDEIIDCPDLLKKIFSDAKVDLSTQRKALLSLTKYNREIYLEKKKPQLLIEYLGDPLDENKVIEVMKKFNYDYNLLDYNVQQSILNYGDLKNIHEVLDCLKGFKYPKLDETIYGNTIFALVVGSSFETINEVTINAMGKHLTPENLIEIPSCLVNQKSSIFLNRKRREDDEEYIQVDLDDLRKNSNFLYSNEIAFELLKGKSNDFMENLDFLEENGFDIQYIFDKCKYLLTFKNSILETNISLYEKYGFAIDCNKDRITNQTFSAFLSNNFAEIADQFIEVHPLGMRYMRDNLSCLKQYSSASDIVFYNIYKSQKPIINKNGVPTLKNAFKEVKNGDTVIIQLCDEITRKNNLYKNSSYRHITEENKIEKTDTYIPTFKNEEYYKLIIKNNYCDISDDIFNNKYIQALERFTDFSNPIVYNFNGVHISKLKVLRIFGLLLENEVSPTLESLMFTITYNTIITENKYFDLNNLISKVLEELR